MLMQRVPRHQAVVVQGLAEPTGPEAPLPVNENRQNGDGPTAPELTLEQVKLHRLPQKWRGDLTVDQGRDGADQPARAESGQDQRKVHLGVGKVRRKANSPD